MTATPTMVVETVTKSFTLAADGKPAVNHKAGEPATLPLHHAYRLGKAGYVPPRSPPVIKDTRPPSIEARMAAAQEKKS